MHTRLCCPHKTHPHRTCLLKTIHSQITYAQSFTEQYTYLPNMHGITETYTSWHYWDIHIQHICLYWATYFNGFVQGCSYPSVLAIEILQSCTEPSIYIQKTCLYRATSISNTLAFTGPHRYPTHSPLLSHIYIQHTCFYWATYTSNTLAFTEPHTSNNFPLLNLIDPTHFYWTSYIQHTCLYRATYIKQLPSPEPHRSNTLLLNLIYPTHLPLPSHIHQTTSFSWTS